MNPFSDLPARIQEIDDCGMLYTASKIAFIRAFLRVV